MRLNLFLSALVLLLLSIVPAAAEKRVALVIGNGAYANAPKLPNPRNDADDISAALKRTGFDTIVGVDLDKSGMDNAAIRFARAARDADVAVFYYSGHAMQFAGVNYLMPIDAKLADEADLRLMVRTDSIVADLQQARNLRILVLDSCRDNPLAEELKRSIGRTRAAGISRGLAKIDTPEGTIVAYATQANKTAEDGTGRNSPYTAAFLKHIEQRDEIGTIFRRISADVYETTKRTQLPELSLSLIGEFYLKGLPASAVAPADAERAREIAALQEQLRDMQEQIKKRDAATALPPTLQKQIVVTPSGMPPPPEPAPVELGERASKQSAVAPVIAPLSSGSAPIELGAAAAKQAKADPYNLPPPPVPPLIEFGQPSVSRPQAPPVAAARPAARDPYNLPPPPVPAPVELGAAAAKRVTADPYNLPPPPVPPELGQQAALAPRAQPSAGAPPASAGPLRHLRDLKGNATGDHVAVTFFPDSRKVVSLGRDRMIRRWDSETGALLRTSQVNDFVDRIALSPDAKRLAVGRFTDTFVYSGFGNDASNPKLDWKDEESNRAGCTGDALAFSPDGRILAKAYPRSSLRLYNASTGKVIRTLPGLDVPQVCQINAAAFTPDGRYLLSSTYRLWDVATGKLVRTLTGGDNQPRNDYNEISMAADGSRVAIATDTQFGVWSIDTGKPVWIVNISNLKEGVIGGAIGYSADGRFVIGAHGSKIFVHDAATGQELQSLTTGGRRVADIKISPDNRRMLSVDKQTGTISVWQIAEPAVASQR